MSDNSRIIQHMNRDHQLALLDYLAVYSNVSPKSINTRSVRISDIDVEKFTINYIDSKSIPQSKTIVFSSANEDDNITVSSLKDLRPKLVSMAVYAAKKQGLSHKRITKVTYPNHPSSYVLWLVFLSAIYATLKPKDFARKIGPISVKLLNNVPDFAGPAVTKILTFLLKYGANIIKGMYIVHIGEILFFTVPNIRKYRVPTPQALQWILFNFVEGYHALQRFGKLTREEH